MIPFICTLTAGIVFRKEGREEGREEGLEQGLKQGRKEGWELGQKEGWELGQREGRELGQKEGWALGKKEGLETSTTAYIIDIMKKLKYTADQAMDLLSIPVENRAMYMGKLDLK